MVYTLFIDRVDQVGDEWYTFAPCARPTPAACATKWLSAQRLSRRGSPPDQVRMYLQCTGGYEIQGDATTKLPCFDYLFTD